MGDLEKERKRQSLNKPAHNAHRPRTVMSTRHLLITVQKYAAAIEPGKYCESNLACIESVKLDIFRGDRTVIDAFVDKLEFGVGAVACHLNLKVDLVI